jgi:hypothetical protein
VTAAAVTAFYRPAERIWPSSGRRVSSPSVVLAHEHETEKSYPVPVWSGLITAKHREAMGTSIWMFLWCLDRITVEGDGWGVVLGGKPVKDLEIAKRFKVHANTVHADRERLVKHRYITARRTPYGFVYRVRNSRKFGIWKKKRSTGNCDSLGQRSTGNCGSDPQETVETKKTQQLTMQQKQQQAVSDNSVWGFLGIAPCGPHAFQSLLENRWDSRNGDKPSVLIGETVDGWEVAHGKKPQGCAPLFRVLSELRKTESVSRRPEANRSPRIPTSADMRPKER